MPDREKVIRAIDGCINIGDYCNDCDYDGCIFHHGSCEKDLLADALALLKEQEAVEPTVSGIEEYDGHSSRWYQCGKCKMPIDYEDRYCRRCGYEVKWDADGETPIPG